jgi:hypothetical protein
LTAGSPIAAGARSAAVANAITSGWPTCSASSAPGRASIRCSTKSTAAAARTLPARRGNVAGQHIAQAHTSCWPAASGAGRAPTPDHRQIPDRRRRAQRGGGQRHHQRLAHLLRQLGAWPAPPSAAAPGRRRPPRSRHRRAAVPALASTTPRHPPAAGRPPSAPGARRHLITARSPIAAGARSAAVAIAITSC